MQWIWKLPESEAGDDEDEEMEDDFQLVQGIPEGTWEGLRGLRDSRHAPSDIRLGGESWTGEAGDEKEDSGTLGETREGRAKGLWEMGTRDSRKAGEVLDDILYNGRNIVKLQTMVQVGEAQTLMDCLVLKVDADGLLIDTRESEEDEAGRVIYGWDVL